MKLKLICLFFLGQFAFAQNHLEPVNSYFDLADYEFDYFQNVRSLLFKNLTDNPEIRMIVFPSFSKELVFQIEKDSVSSDFYNIIINEPKEGSIWGIDKGNPNPEIQTNTFKSKINKEDFSLIYELLYSAIKKTRFRTDNSMGLDGTTYFLSVKYLGLKSTEIWSPKNPNLKELVFIMKTLIEKSKKENKINFSKDLKNSIVKLTHKINKKLTHEEIDFLLKFNQNILEIENQYSSSYPENALTDELYEIYDEVNSLTENQGIYYSKIDEIILNHKQYFDAESFEELNRNEIEKIEKNLKENNPFQKLLELYKNF